MVILKIINRMIKNKKAQHEILGFVLIVLIVSIIGVIFLSISIAKGKGQKQNSVEISNFLESAMYYTTDCAISSFPKYQELQDLIKKCYDSPNQRCISRDNCEAPPVNYGMSFSVNAKQGPWEHQNPKGDAKAPLFVSNVKEGDKIKITGISGKFTIYKGSIPYEECGKNGGYSPKIGFYNDNKRLIKEYNLVENEFEVPAGATRLYAYLRDSNYYYYNDDGKCTFVFQKNAVSEPVPECKLVDERGVCKALEDNLNYILDKSLVIGEDSPIKAYRLQIYFSSETNLDPLTDVLFIEKGIFKNCTSVVGGDHQIPIGSFSSGSLNVELESCNG